ncbi:catechol O-methyltransferase-like [Pelobates fuscus]|uniref:catechol O-methyltransferase-like n=1 Tax=Pelobates fuscus TaxID=191477 RepID=UPI002FE4D6F1
MIPALMASSSLVLLTGLIVPFCTGMVWILYKYRFWKMDTLVVDVKTQQALRRYVLFESVHGKPDSVLLTYKEYAKQDRRIKGLIFTAEQDIFLADVVKKYNPLTAVALGTQCGYSAIQLLTLLPSNGKLYAVEQDENMVESAEEMILVSGFKNQQFSMLFQHPIDAIHALSNHINENKVDLVLMDHQPDQYLQALQALEEVGVLHQGTLILANNIEQSAAKEFMDHLQSHLYFEIISSCQGLIAIQCTKTRVFNYND